MQQEEPKQKLRETQNSSCGISRRAVIIGLLLVPINVYWVIVAELRWYVILTLNPLFVTPIFYLFLLLGLNAVLRRFWSRHVLKPGELVVIYVMLVMSCTIATHDFIINLMSTIGWTRWFATPENRWESVLFPHLPRWLLIWDKEVLTGYFCGNAKLYDWKVLKAWLPPLGFWSIFIFSIGWTTLCLATVFRRAWIDDTRLSFPIVRLPLAMTEEGNLGLASKTLWLGFSVAVCLGIINGLHEYIPNLPHFRVRHRWLNFQTPPWTATAPMCVTFYPFAIGLAFLVPLDVSFSCWFFYLFVKAQAVLGYYFGYWNIRDFPFVKEQGIGAWLAYGVFLLYISKHYLAKVLRSASNPSEERGPAEPMSQRTAVWGTVAGMVVFVVFWCAAGMSPGWAVVVMSTYFLLALCITRVRAEAGGQHTVWDLEPMNLFRLFDSRMLGPANLGAAAVSHWYWRLNRSHPMPSEMEAFKLAQDHGMSPKQLVGPILVTVALATVFGMWACLHVCYKEGALAKCQGFGIWTGTESHNWLEMSINNGFKADPSRWSVTLGAAGLVLILFWLRSLFPKFPFHPLGYCIGPGLIWLWFPFLLAWLAKFLILRYGGLKLYRQSLPFFLGLVLGDYVIGAVWSLIGVVWEIPTLQIFH